ncbi:alpha-L-fucosidase [Mucilaginibacter sp. SG564]|uniref:alpha-L-fucosidase n=1 Tax=unclassified Mucilaginibacter TaxID=2617802 RepID=UPI001552CE0B|nr:alpha-L-fucosidase [Mucilaginibacter sp. SG564]NOW96496.1 alpha-L-fucosidase [Mucilaginibacter sp. SG564]
MKNILLIIALSFCSAAYAQNKSAKISNLHFGMFICWSLSTFSDEEWTRGITDVSFFNPTDANTDQWCKVAKDAGMDYILFLTKHHDGFCLWNTKTTNWKVTNSPWKKDVLASLKKSCEKYDLKLALYFSEADWTWIPKDLKPEDFVNKENYWRMGRNSELKKAQLKELCTLYGPIAYFWFDHAQSDGGLNHEATAEWIKQFQPDCMVGFNNGETAGDIRLGEMGKPGPLNSAEGGGPYNKVIHRGFKKAEFTYPILGKERWFYTSPANDTVCRTPEEIIEDYKGAIKYDNFFALDVGPGRDGKLRDIDVKTLTKVGEMIRKIKKGQ